MNEILNHEAAGLKNKDQTINSNSKGELIKKTMDQIIDTLFKKSLSSESSKIS